MEKKKISCWKKNEAQEKEMIEKGSQDNRRQHTLLKLMSELKCFWTKNLKDLSFLEPGCLRDN
jgi:hypothetical protein